MVITSQVFHLMMLLEFLQIMFLVFNKVSISNEFVETHTQSNSTGLMSNQTFAFNHTAESGDSSIDLSSLLKFTNFHAYTLE